MSELLSRVANSVNRRLPSGGFTGCLHVEIENEGRIVIDGDGARVSTLPDGAGDGATTTARSEPDCTLRVDSDTCSALLARTLDPMTAYLNGRLRVAGDITFVTMLGRMLR